MDIHERCAPTAHAAHQSDPALLLIGFTRAVAVSALLILGACSEKPATDSRIKAPVAAAPTVLSGTTEAAFAEVLPQTLKGELAFRPDCNIERINGQDFATEPYKIAASSTMELTGWVIDVAGGGVPQSVFIRVASEDGHQVWFAPATLSVERADLVALRGGDEAYRRSGFDTKVKSGALPTGRYRLQVIYSGHREKALCDNGRGLIVN
jgi:hypothetical protein